MKPDIQLGAWIVAAQKALSKWNANELVLDPFDAIIVAGRAGELFSATRAMGTVSGKKFEVYRKLALLKPTVAQQVLHIAETLKLVDVAWSSNPNHVVDRFSFRANSKEGVLEAVGAIFPRLHPSDISRVALEILAATLELPVTIDQAKNLLSARKFAEEDVNAAIKLITELGLISRTVEKEAGSSLLFNPYSFENDATDVYKSLKVLSREDHDKALKLIEFVRKHPGVPIPKTTDKSILALLVKLGIVDYSKIVTMTGQNDAYFPTAPQVWGVFDKTAGTPLSQDLVDDSKLLLNSFRFGQFFSHPNRGQIRDPADIVNALINHGSVGSVKPATAIGEDYPLPLSRGIVNIVESPRYPGRYSMELLKYDVAIAVKEIFEQSTLLPTETVVTRSDLQRADSFTSPGAVRIEQSLPEALRKEQEEMIFSLRTSRRTR
jgi:hypothetical protein